MCHVNVECVRNEGTFMNEANVYASKLIFKGAASFQLVVILLDIIIFLLIITILPGNDQDTLQFSLLIAKKLPAFIFDLTGINRRNGSSMRECCI